MTKNSKLIKIQFYKHGRKIYLKLPLSYHKIISNYGNEYYEYLYYYPDSSLIYVSDDMGGGPNDQNINKHRDSYYRLFDIYGKNRINGYTLADTLSLEGQDSLGLYWKNYFVRGYNIGYLKVAKSKKNIYDKVIENLKIK